MLLEILHEMAQEIIRDREEGKNLFNKAAIAGILAFGMGRWGANQSASSLGN